MATEHELVSLLEGCLTCAPALAKLPIGQKIKKAIEEFNQAEALGFRTVAEMKEHRAWLKKHGTREYREWLASFMPEVTDR